MCVGITKKNNNIDKTIKLWKVYERNLKTVSESSMMTDVDMPTGVVGNFGSSLSMPKISHQDSIVAAIPRRIYANGKNYKIPENEIISIITRPSFFLAHAYHINSISINSDGETYISADDLRVNLWNLDISDQSFSEFLNFILFFLRVYAYIIISRYCRYQTC